jgi:hypothetical protein
MSVHRPGLLAAALLLANALPAVAADADRPARPRPMAGALGVGVPAPDFTLPLLGGNNETVALSSFRDKKPVLLVFGSYT